MKGENEMRSQFELTVGGLKIFGIIHEPLHSQKPYPFVFMFHGFGGSKSGRHRYFVELSSRLAEQNIASIRFDFRGAGDSEGKFEEQTVTSQLDDMRAVFAFAQSLPQLDISRFGLFGRSFGGFLSVLFGSELVTLDKHPQSIALVVPFFGVSKMEIAYPLSWNKEKGQLTFHGMPISNELIDDIKKHSARSALEVLSDIPLMHTQAGKDVVVGYDNLKEYQLCRSISKAESLFIELPQSDHELSDYDERMQSIDQVVKWFKKTL